jgi:hypothetical protein
MAKGALTNMPPADVVEVAARELVRVKKWGQISYINLPMILPSGSFATVRVSPIASGFRVDDGGFAYRELESVGMERSFGRTAAKVAEALDVDHNRRTLTVDVAPDDLFRAICDVGMASRDVAERVFSRLAEQDEAEIEDYLMERLAKIFGSARLEGSQKIVGSSTNQWDVSAILHTDSGLAVFQAVGNHANSIYRASTAFHDLSELPNPPVRIAVVKDKAALGAKLNMLAQAGRVIEGDQPDDVYVRAAA